MSFQSAPYLLEFSRVTIIRGDTAALNDVSLKIPVGQNVAILGPNGSGKSSLIKAIARECYPLATDATFVKILGQDTWDVFELRKHLGMVSADTIAPNSRISCRDAVLSGFFATFSLWRNTGVTDEMQAKTLQSMNDLGVAHISGKPFCELSSGEARRVIIARALAHQPPSLLLDEPMANLDILASAKLKDTLSKLARGGTQILLVTHNIADIIPEIDRVIMLKNGRIVADGSREELLTSARLSGLFDMELKVVEDGGFYHLIRANPIPV